jgi:hypothetical protein
VASSNRRLLRRVAVGVALLVVIVAAWVLPAVYHARYDPATHSDGAGPAATTAGAGPAATTAGAGSAGPTRAAAATSVDPASATQPLWHPLPTPEQDRAYVENTRSTAAHPGQAVAGRDGYLFLGDDYMANFAQAMGRRFYSPDEVALTVAAVQSSKAWLANRGIASEFVVVPATWSVYTDKMPAWTDGAVLPHVLDQLIAADSASFVDLRPDLIAQRATADTYPRLNSHWTPFGSYVGFRTLIGRLEADHPDLGTLPVPTLTGTTTTDAFNEFAGITGAAGPNDWVVPQFAAPLPPYTVIAADGTRTTAAGDEFLDLTKMPLQTENSAAGNEHRALILADSATSVMSPYLAAAFGSTLMVRHWVDQPSEAPNIPALVASYQPDVVITLVSERNLNIVTPDSAAWQAAAAYDRGDRQPLGEWTSTGDGTLTVSGSDLSASATATLPAAPPGPVAVRIALDATDVGTLTVTGSTAAGPVTASARVARGSNILFAQLPAGLTDPTLTIARSSGQGSWTATAVSVRALP